jgi:hypothetical protein
MFDHFRPVASRIQGVGIRRNHRAIGCPVFQVGQAIEGIIGILCYCPVWIGGGLQALQSIPSPRSG